MTKDIDKSKKELIDEIESLLQRNKELENLKKKSEEEVEKTIQSKLMLLANISYDIRIPMNGIIGMTELLKQTQLTDEQKEFINIIANSGNNLLTTVNNILDFSKIEVNQLDLVYKNLNIRNKINEIEKLLSLKAKGKGISLYTTIDKSVPDFVKGDPVRLKQIIINLTNNAIKYTKEGNVTIKVETIKEKVKTIKLRFSIIDTGIGVPEEKKEKLNEVLSKKKNKNSFESGVIGLGLAISKSLIDLMGGDIGFESKTSKGSTFWFTIDFEKVSETPDKIIKEKPYLKTKKPLSILLVEDNILNKKFAYATLVKSGHKVDVAENGKIAIEKYQQGKYDLILMDIQMPVMDGLIATKKIREIEIMKQKSKKIKIVAVTAYALEHDRVECLEAGMDDYLSKPFKPLELINLIDNLNI